MKSSHTASQMDRLSAPGGTRFHIAVYNYERIHSFINNFHRIRNFNPDLDRIVVWDCSKKFQDQERQLREFCKREGFSFGEHVIILSRRNYGIDQGARLDYFNALLHMKQPPRYIWQFQDHYLDLDASFSWWPAHEKSKPYLKTDTIPDGVVLDLNRCTEIFENDPSAALIYADRGRIKIFKNKGGEEWLYTSGGNFCFRSGKVLPLLKEYGLSQYSFIYEDNYTWAVFMEIEWGRLFSRAALKWNDLVTGFGFSSVNEVKAKESSENLSITSCGVYTDYEEVEAKYRNLLNQPKLSVIADTIFRKIRQGPALAPIRKPLRTLRRTWFSFRFEKGTFQNLILIMILAWRLKKFKFVEIGVFKGDNAIRVINLVQTLRRKISYVGFDLFDEADIFYKEYCPQEWEVFASVNDYPYWEFTSGGHKYQFVREKIAAVLPEDSFHLIPGNSQKTISQNEEQLSDAALVFIDGAHDYDFVRSDWMQVEKIFNKQVNLVVAFDDSTYEGVQRIKEEIQSSNCYHCFRLNPNQFFVVSKKMKWHRKFLLKFLSGSAEG